MLSDMPRLLMRQAQPTLKRPRNPMPAFVREALEAKKLVAYEARPPYQRNDYLGWRRCSMIWSAGAGLDFGQPLHTLYV